MKIALGPETVRFIKKLSDIKSQKLIIIAETFNLADPKTIELAKLNDWFIQSKVLRLDLDEELQMLLASLNAALLKDLAKTFPDYKEKKKEEEKGSNYFKYILLLIAGTLCLGCEGFDGITSIVSILPLSATVLLVVGGVFALISVMLFYAFDLSVVAESLGIKKKNDPQLVDIYLEEVEAAKSIRRSLSSQHLKRQTAEALEEGLQITELLIASYQRLDQGRKTLTQSLKSKTLGALQYAVVIVIGFMYFSGGFFAGQAVAVAITGLFVASTTPVFWPIFGLSFVVGLAALSLYWVVYRPDTERLVSRLYGFDQEKIEALPDAEKIERQEAKLEALKTNIESLLADSNKDRGGEVKLGVAGQGRGNLIVQKSKQDRITPSPPSPPSFFEGSDYFFYKAKLEFKSLEIQNCFDEGDSDPALGS